MSLRDQLLSAGATPLKPVEVPEWGATVYIRMPIVAESDEVIAMGESFKVKDFAKIVAFVARDEAGNRIFTQDDIEAIRKLDFNGATRIVIAYNALDNSEADAKN